jgi:hypothetical protein
MKNLESLKKELAEIQIMKEDIIIKQNYKSAESLMLKEKEVKLKIEKIENKDKTDE